MASTLATPSAVSRMAWTRIGLRRRARLELGEQLVDVVDVPRPLDLGHHHDVELVADRGDDLEQVVENPGRVEGVDAGPEAGARGREIGVARHGDEALAGRLLLVGRHRVLEVAEHHVHGLGEFRHARPDLLVVGRHEVDHPLELHRQVPERGRRAGGEGLEEAARQFHRRLGLLKIGDPDWIVGGRTRAGRELPPSARARRRKARIGGGGRRTGPAGPACGAAPGRPGTVPTRSRGWNWAAKLEFFLPRRVFRPGTKAMSGLTKRHILLCAAVLTLGAGTPQASLAGPDRATAQGAPSARVAFTAGELSAARPEGLRGALRIAGDDAAAFQALIDGAAAAATLARPLGGRRERRLRGGPPQRLEPGRHPARVRRDHGGQHGGADRPLRLRGRAGGRHPEGGLHHHLGGRRVRVRRHQRGAHRHLAPEAPHRQGGDAGAPQGGGGRARQGPAAPRGDHRGRCRAPGALGHGRHRDRGRPQGALPVPRRHPGLLGGARRVPARDGRGGEPRRQGVPGDARGRGHHGPVLPRAGRGADRGGPPADPRDARSTS